VQQPKKIILAVLTGLCLIMLACGENRFRELLGFSIFIPLCWIFAWLLRKNKDKLLVIFLLSAGLLLLLLGINMPRKELWPLFITTIYFCYLGLREHHCQSVPSPFFERYFIALGGLAVLWYAIYSGEQEKSLFFVYLPVGLTIMILSWLLQQPEFLAQKVFRVGLLLSVLIVLSLALLAAFNLHSGIGDRFLLLQQILFSDKDSIKKSPSPGQKPHWNEALSPIPLGNSGPENKKYLCAYLELQKEASQGQINLPIYLRQAAYAHFTGDKWLPAAGKSYWLNDSGDGKKDGWTHTGDRIRLLRQMQYIVYWVNYRSRRVLLMPGPTAIAVPQLRHAIDDSYIIPVRRGVKLAYYARSSPLNWEEVGIYDPQVEITNSVYTELPVVPVSQIIRDLAARAVGSTVKVSDKIDSIRNFMHRNYTYSPKKKTGPEQNALENFLLVEKEGHCVLHATAFTLLLRASDIPARIVIGFSSCNLDRQEGVYAFYNTDYHCWTEIYIKDYGWVTADSTPASGKPLKMVSTAFAEQFHDFNFITEPNEITDDGNRMAGLAGTKIRQYGLVSLIIMMLFGAVAGIIGYQLVLRKRSTVTTGPKSIPVSATLTNFFSCLCRHYAQAGFPRLPGQTANEYLVQLKNAGIITDELDDMINYYYHINYHGKLPSREKEKAFLRQIKHLTSSKY